MTPEVKAKIEAWVYQRGHEKGREKGREEGRVSMQTVVIELARTKLGEVTPSDVHAIEAIDDDSALNDLALALARAVTAAEVRAILDRIA